MTIKPTFNRTYFLLAILLLIVEILIAKFAHDKIIRPYVGDMLVVILIYCFIKSFVNTPVIATAMFVLLFSYVVEVLQYFKIVKLLGLQHSELARTIIGTSFEWIDMVAYTVGVALIVLLKDLCKKEGILLHL